MKTYKEILADLTKTFIDEQNEVTFFGKSSVIRAVFSAFAGVISEIWNDLYQIKRQIFPETSEGDALDIVVGRKGMIRQTATKSSVVLTFKGTEGTTIPINTQVRNANTGIIYQTLNEIVIQSFSNAYDNEYSNIVLAESIDTGSATISKAGELTTLITPITGITSVTNFFASTGGTDFESDSDLRLRYMERINILAQGTKAYYETIAKEYSGILAKAKFNGYSGGIDVFVLKNNLSLYSDLELVSMKEKIEEGTKALCPVVVYNASQKLINIYIRYLRDTNYSSNEVINNVNTSLSALIDPRVIGYGSTLKYSDVLKSIINSVGVKEIKVGTLSVNNAKNDIVCGSFEIPRLNNIKMQDQYTEAIHQDLEYYYTE